jgi:hypothetical protein
LATRQEFLLGRWIAAAKRWGATEEETRHCEWNARNQITLWGPRFSVLHEYAYKQWSDLVAGFYFPRWKRFTERLSAALDGTPFDAEAFNKDITAWEETWTHQTEPHPAQPQGDPVAVARALFAKYGSSIVDQSAPSVPSLTTGKPVTCSSALPQYPARLANDGRSDDPDQYWATDVSTDKEPWWQVDLESPATVGRVVVICYYGDERYYGFAVDASLDGEHWEQVADRRDNKKPSTSEGYACRFEPRSVRYIRVTQPYNSANTGRHLVEVMAFEK